MSRRVARLARLPLTLSALLALLVATPATAMAAEHAAAKFLGLPVTLWLWANLLLFLFLLYKFLGPPILGFLTARSAEIARSFEQAKEQDEQARELRATLAAKVTAIEREMEELLEKARADGERERLEVLAQAERERDKLLAQTRDEIAHRMEQARQQLTAFTAQLAAELAQRQVEGQLTAADRQRLFSESLTRLEAGKNEGAS